MTTKQDYVTALLESSDPENLFREYKDKQILANFFPSLHKLFGVPQVKEHHPEVDTGEHIALCLRQANRICPGNRAVLLAALCHDLGKGLTSQEILPRHPGHEKEGLPLVDDFFKDLPYTSVYEHLVAKKVCEFHLHCHKMLEMTPKGVIRLFENLKMGLRYHTFLDDFANACLADKRGRTNCENRDYIQKEVFLKSMTLLQNMEASRPDQESEAFQKWHGYRLSKLAGLLKALSSDKQD